MAKGGGSFLFQRNAVFYLDLSGVADSVVFIATPEEEPKMAIIAQLHRYHQGNSKIEEVLLPSHVTVTGKEDHFALAYHDVDMIMKGLRIADPDARWTIRSISLD